MPECKDHSVKNNSDTKVSAQTDIEIHELITRVERKAADVMEKLRKLSLTIALAESCTSGLVSSFLANTSGASDILWGSFVCYTQEAKVLMLGLDNEELSVNGLVSSETACSMALSALQKSSASLAVAVTGLAGQESDGKVPGGTIWIVIACCSAAWQTVDHNGVMDVKIQVKKFHFTDSRNVNRLHAVEAVFDMLLEELLK